MLSGPYVVIIQLIKFIWKISPPRKPFTIHVRGKTKSIQQKMTKIGTFKNKAQILFHSYLLVKIFIVIFSIHIFLSIMYHILSP
jgi:hypothetical protein